MKIPASSYRTGNFKNEAQKAAFQSANEISRDCYKIADTMKGFDERSADVAKGSSDVWIDRETAPGVDGMLSGTLRMGNDGDVAKLDAQTITYRGDRQHYTINRDSKGVKFESPLGAATFDAKGNIVVDLKPTRDNDIGSFYTPPEFRRRWD